jgi:peptide deformylase
MATRSIRLFGDPILRTAAEPVVDFDRELHGLVKDLTDTMLDAAGAGLAAPQIGVSLRVFTYHVDDVIGHLINPELELSADEQVGPEGCLSLPGLEYDCRRALRVVAQGVDMHGDPLVIEGDQLLARAIQHETDHLNGVLFIDKLDREARKAAMRAIREADWAGHEPPEVKLSPHATFGRAT